MTMPNLMTSLKAHKLRTQFLKSYSVAQQAFKQMEANGESLDPSTYGTAKFYKTYMKYFQGVTDCGNLSSSFNHDKPCYNIDNSKHYKSLDGNTDIHRQYFDDGQFLLNDGSLFLLENPYISRIWVSVDINGFNNPPNRWGYDLFTFQFYDGELRTMGDLKTLYKDLDIYCNLKSNNVLNGIACAYRAKTETDYFKWVVKNVK